MQWGEAQEDVPQVTSQWALLTDKIHAETNTLTVVYFEPMAQFLCSPLCTNKCLRALWLTFSNNVEMLKHHKK